jgi:hypothetical protein
MGFFFQGDIQKAVDEGSFFAHLAGVQHFSIPRLKEIVPLPKDITKYVQMFTIANKSPWARELRNLRVAMPAWHDTLPAAIKKGQADQQNPDDPAEIFPQDRQRIPGIKFLLMAKQVKVDPDPRDGKCFDLPFTAFYFLFCFFAYTSLNEQLSDSVYSCCRHPFCQDWYNSRK